jgi:hypothetical protein
VPDRCRGSAEKAPWWRWARRSNCPRTPQPRRGAPGRLQLYVDGTLVAEEQAPVTTPFALNPGALTCGVNPGSPVTPDYLSPFRFTSTLRTVTVDLSGELITDSESEMRLAMARQ